MQDANTTAGIQTDHKLTLNLIMMHLQPCAA